MSNKTEINIDELLRMAEEDIEKAVTYEFRSDKSDLAKRIYKDLFYFYCEEKFSGDLIFTWKSPSLVKGGDYIGKRDSPVDNVRVIGNIFPNFKTNRKYSLNLNRNGHFGDFPHDYPDIFLDHIAKYAYEKDIKNIKEYYPLKRAILYDRNMDYFKRFSGFEKFLQDNFFEEIWAASKEVPFSDMEFDRFKETSIRLMRIRGERMLKKLIEVNKNKI